MYKKLRVSLVIPAYNEEKLIADTLRGVPKSIDRIYVIDDASRDRTAEIVRRFRDRRVKLIRHEKNQGVGGAVITGYKKSAEEKFDVAVVVGGDNQMDLQELPVFLEPFVKNEADYVKGNRFLMKSLKVMPKHRLFGNSALSLMTKMASGYWKIFDMHDGYTAISRKAIETVDWDRAWKGYGYPSDFLIRLNVHNLRVKDVPRRTIYLKGERQSQIKIGRYIFRVFPMIVRGFFWRMKEKYILRDFHPLVFFYFLGLILFPTGLIVGLTLIWDKIFTGVVSGSTAILCALFVITGLQLLLFGMLFDMEQSK